MIRRIDGINYINNYRNNNKRRKIDNTNFQGAAGTPNGGLNYKRAFRATGIAALAIAAGVAITNTLRSIYDRTFGFMEEEVTVATDSAEVANIFKDRDIPQLDTIVLTSPKTHILEDGYAVVKKGDTYWSIARDILVERGIENPTNNQINKETNRLLEVNYRDYPSDDCDVVLIYEGDKIFVDEVPDDYKEFIDIDDSEEFITTEDGTFRVIKDC